MISTPGRLVGDPAAVNAPTLWQAVSSVYDRSMLRSTADATQALLILLKFVNRDIQAGSDVFCAEDGHRGSVSRAGRIFSPDGYACPVKDVCRLTTAAVGA